jgi:hypothetical protein
MCAYRAVAQATKPAAAQKSNGGGRKVALAEEARSGMQEKNPANGCLVNGYAAGDEPVTRRHKEGRLNVEKRSSA